MKGWLVKTYVACSLEQKNVFDIIYSVAYKLQMFIVKKTHYFTEWLDSLKDKQVQKKIAARIFRLEYGLLGDVKYFRGIGELKINYGPGYRIYFVKQGKQIILLLNAGDKSTQQKDIEKALQLVKEMKHGNY